MFRKILVPLDGSETAEQAMPWLRRYAGPPKAQVVLLRVLESGAQNGAAEAREYLQGIERELNYRGIPAKILVRRGRVADAIAGASQDEGCDFILMATRGGRRVERWLVGGMAEQVMRRARVPVMVTRRDMAVPAQGRMRRILVPLDGSLLAEGILPWAEKLARFHRAELTLLHVYPEGAAGLRTSHEETYEHLKRRALHACGELRRRGVRVVFRVERGDAAAEILRVARRFNLIAMTTHGYGGFKRWVFGSVAEQVLHAAQIPVLVYRSPARARMRQPVAAAAT